jgi:hypothetical protein
MLEHVQQLEISVLGDVLGVSGERAFGSCGGFSRSSFMLQTAKSVSTVD